MRIRSFAAVTALAVASAPLLAAPAQSADTTLGGVFADSTQCGTGSAAEGLTFLQTGPSSYSAPTAGIITSWSAQTATDFTAALRVARPGAEGTYSVIGKAATVQVAPGQDRQPVRVPVRAGDVLGVFYPSQDSNFPCGREADSTFTVALGQGDATMTGGSFPNFQLNVAATLEADADGDGYGDTTQDKCPTQATTQGACADVTAPQTTITKVKAAKVKAGAKGNKAKAKVTVAFRANEASAFTCSVDGKAFTACKSPLTRRLKAGTHTIAVRAKDAAGNLDKTPATVKVKVKRATR